MDVLIGVSVPDQINGVIACPGFFRGLFDAARCDITSSMLTAPAQATVDQAAPAERNAGCIVPGGFDPAVVGAVVEVVRSAPAH